ncbi:MAG: cytochrome b, partial [Methylophilaceae bacterium]
FFRLLFRLTSHTPTIQPNLGKLVHYSARAMHFVLYLLMIGTPIAGWLMLSAAGKPIPFFGFELPPLISADKELADTVKKLHEITGSIGYFLIFTHAIAGLHHHYIKRDNALIRMLP